MSLPTAFIERARATKIERVIDEHGIRLRGRIEREGPCPVCGGADRFSINVAKQVFNCRGCDKGGDVIALVQHLDGLSFVDACSSLAGERKANVMIPRTSDRSAPREEDSNKQRRDTALYFWRMSQPPTDTPVDIYLHTVRGITSPLPSTVHYLPPNKPGHHPAMIVPYGLPDEPEPGLLEIAETQITAVQLTLLKPDGSDKADVKPNKINVASPAGMPMVLAPMNGLLGLVITEGVEDALSVHCATGLGAWASGGASFMPKLMTAIKDLSSREYDASPECVTIYADDDEPGRRHSPELAEALANRGIDVFIEGVAP